jgi:hypothetical protein
VGHNSGGESGGDLLRRPYRGFGIVRIEGIVGTDCDMAEFAGAVGGTDQGCRQNGRSAVGGSTGALDQIGVPLAAARRLFSLNLNDAQQRLFQRGMPGEHCVHERHPPDIPVHAVVIQAHLPVDLDGA